METTGRTDTQQQDAFLPVAALWHTIVVLVAEGLQITRGFVRAEALRTMAHPDRIRLYERTILIEWFTVGLVLGGLWLYGSSPLVIFGDRWHSVRDFFRDIGIGILFLVATIAVTSILGSHHSTGDRETQFLLPQTTIEKILWIAVSLTAGICEEALYRGYLQRQFVALTKSVAAGIGISALLFGLAHLYQGWQRAASISVLGAMAGSLAYWRRSLRPGMIAHSLQDVLGAIIRH